MSTANAQCITYPTHAAYFEEAKTVFIGTATAVRATGARGTHALVSDATFRVERTWKGNPGRQVGVKADRPFIRGERYLVFAAGTPLTTSLLCRWTLAEERAHTRLAWLESREDGSVTGSRDRHRYFKEDHGTGADYMRLRSDGTYTITSREHMGVWVTQAGRWRTSDGEISFTPAGDKPPYRGREDTFDTDRFLVFNSDAAPSIIVSAEEIKRELATRPDALPLYVFFEIPRAVYDRETNETYPFRTLRK